MDFLLLKICLLCACFSYVWVDVLTSTRGLLGWFPAYYPEKIRDKPLMCAECLSGWLSMLSVFCIFTYTWGFIDLLVYFYTFMAPFVSMSIVKIIKR